VFTEAVNKRIRHAQHETACTYAVSALRLRRCRLHWKGGVGA